MFKTLNAFSLISKLNTLHIGNVARQSTCAPGIQLATSVPITFNNRFFSNEISGTEKIAIPTPPKRSLNVFALFIKDQFKKYPSDMPVKEKFVKAGQDWRSLTVEEKEVYKKMTTENFVQYRKDMTAYYESLSPEALTQYKQLIKNKTKEKTRLRIKLKLRKLNYPKKNCSAYNFFIREQLKITYPDGNYPSVRTPEHIRHIGVWSKLWRTMTADDRKEFTDLAEADRVRYFDELEKWKQELAKPENEEEFHQLERLSRKMEACSAKDDAKLKKRQRLRAAKVIKNRKQKKSKSLKK